MATGELKLFLEIWDERNHYCTSCDKYLGEIPNICYFSHIIKKSQRRDLRLVKENVMLECFKCHQIWEFGTKEQKKKMNNFESKLEYLKENHKSLYFKLHD